MRSGTTGHESKSQLLKPLRKIKSCLRQTASGSRETWVAGQRTGRAHCGQLISELPGDAFPRWKITWVSPLTLRGSCSGPPSTKGELRQLSSHPPASTSAHLNSNSEHCRKYTDFRAILWFNRQKVNRQCSSFTLAVRKLCPAVERLLLDPHSTSYGASVNTANHVSFPIAYWYNLDAHDDLMCPRESAPEGGHLGSFFPNSLPFL